MERQLFPIEKVAGDHLGRYKFALDTIGKAKTKDVPWKVLDAACGCGYGSWILSHGNYVHGVDIHKGAIDYARIQYSGPKYINGDLYKKPWRGKFDAVVCFETLEHLKEPVQVLKNFRLSADYLIASVPNEEQYPFNPETFASDEYPHIRHYTPIEFVELLESGGWVVISTHCQDKGQGEVRYGTDGRFLVYVCV